MPRERAFLTSIDPYIVALVPFAARDYPPVVPFDELLEDNCYRKSSFDMPHISALSWSKVVNRSDVTAVKKNLIYGPWIPDSSCLLLP